MEPCLFFYNSLSSLRASAVLRRVRVTLRRGGTWRIRGRGVTFSRLNLLLVPRDAYVANLVSALSANL